jgi:hypothetical protein
MFPSSPSIMLPLAQDLLRERRADADRVRLLDLARPPRGAFARLLAAQGRGASAIAARPTPTGSAPCCVGAA